MTEQPQTELEQMDNRALDALVAERVMGWTSDGEFWRDEIGLKAGAVPGTYMPDPTGSCVYAPFAPTTDGAAMLEVLEKMRERDFWASCVLKTGCDIDNWDDPKWEVVFRCVYGATRRSSVAYADTLPKAVALASLQAMEQEQGKETNP